MSYKKILTIQDISCVGQCSLTVALPILSACGLETCILPSAVLSNHTTGFGGYTFRDLTDDMPAIRQQWQKEGIRFEAIYTGYLGNTKQIDYVMDIFDTMGTSECVKIVDPAMADNGRLYPGFDGEYVAAVGRLCSCAHVILPNITEACLLTDTEYRTEYDETYIRMLMDKLVKLGAKTIILTGVAYTSDKTGVAIFENGKMSYYEHDRITEGSHGTGDVFASAFTGALLNDKPVFEAAKIAADYTVKCIEHTRKDAAHWYGVKFELALRDLMEMLK
ncbi:MAG: pyridoxamine kinase [Firmicutes bacterium]|nr:pyridoxamine kinase [Bacillota bacterium]